MSTSGGCGYQSPSTMVWELAVCPSAYGNASRSPWAPPPGRERTAPPLVPGEVLPQLEHAGDGASARLQLVGPQGGGVADVAAQVPPPTAAQREV